MRSQYKCARCGRPIKLGKEKFLEGRPYGSFCFERALAALEIEHRRSSFIKATQSEDDVDKAN